MAWLYLISMKASVIYNLIEVFDHQLVSSKYNISYWVPIFHLSAFERLYYDIQRANDKCYLLNRWSSRTSVCCVATLASSAPLPDRIPWVVLELQYLTVPSSGYIQEKKVKQWFSPGFLNSSRYISLHRQDVQYCQNFKTKYNLLDNKMLRTGKC